MTMNSDIRNMTIIVLLICISTLGSASVYAGVLSGEVIAGEVSSQISALAEERSLDVEVSIPRAHDVTAPGVDNPGLAVTVLDGFDGPRIRSRVEVLDETGKTVRTVQYVAGVSIFKTVAVAGVDFRRGDVIEPADIEYKRIDIATIDGYYEETDSLEDMQAARSISAGIPLTSTNMKPVPLIKRGDRVMVTTRIGSVVAMIEGTARQDGGRGETIRVLNEVTRKSLEGVVINERTVQVGF